MGRVLTYLVLAACSITSATADSISVLSAPKDFKVAEQSEPLSMIDVADVLSQSIGLPSLSHKNKVYTAVNPLSLPTASVLFTVDDMSVSSSDVSDLVSFSEVAVSKGLDSIATIVSMLTGRLPSEHLIPGRMWLGKTDVEHGLVTPDTRALAGNLADAVTKMFDHSVTVSLSADKQFAYAAAPNAEVNEGNSAKSYIYGYDVETSSFELMSGGEQLGSTKLTRRAIMKAMPEFVATYHPIEMTFDLDNKIDFKFFAELIATQMVLKNAMDESTQKSVGAHPDFFSFAFTVLPELSARYGVDSTQCTEAKRIYVEFIQNMSKLVNEHYSNTAVVSMVSLSHREDMPVAARRPFYNPMKRTRRQESAKYPSSYADCLVPGASFPDTDYCDYGPNHAIFFNIFFWLSVFLIGIVWMTIWAQATMPVQDSVIFRMTGSLRPKMD
eukprot:CFRG7227T1